MNIDYTMSKRLVTAREGVGVPLGSFREKYPVLLWYLLSLHPLLRRALEETVNVLRLRFTVTVTKREMEELRS